MSALIYSNKDDNGKRFQSRRYYLPKGTTENYNVIINGKNFNDQPSDSDIKRYEEIRKLTTDQGEDFAAGCLLDYDCIKNHYRLIVVDLNKQKELVADPKAIQLGQLKNTDDTIITNEAMFVLTIIEKIKEKRIKFSQRSVTVL